MGVYIPGIKMPVIVGNRGIKAEIRQIDGKLEFGIMTGGYSCCEQWTYYPLVPVPQHGRLGDLDALKARATKRLYASNHGSMAEAYCAALIDLIDAEPAVIPADTGG